MIEVTTEWLQSIDELSDVPVGQLLWLIQHSESRVLMRDEFMFQAGQPMTGTDIIVTGSVRIYLLQNKSAVLCVTNAKYSAFVTPSWIWGSSSKRADLHAKPSGRWDDGADGGATGPSGPG